MKVEDALEERGTRYGVFMDNARCAQDLKEVVRRHRREDGTYPFEEMKPDQAEAVDNILQKIARLTNGDPNYIDNWLDIEGYARLVRERLEREQCPTQQTNLSPST